MTLEAGECPDCRAYIACPADHDTDCPRAVDSEVTV